MNRPSLYFAASFVMASCFTCAAVAQGGSCKDPWVNQAYNKLYHRAPAGSGTSGECNPAEYGGGHWTTYNDLEAKILQSKHTVERAAPAPAAAAPQASLTLHLDRSLNLVDTRGQVVAPAGSFDLIKSNGNLVSASSIVAQGGGNIVAQGGGNIVAQGGGNFHTQSVGSRPRYVVQ